MTVVQCGFIASASGEPGCSREISSAAPIEVAGPIELTQVYPGGWGFGLAATSDRQLYIWGVNAATMVGRGGPADEGSDPTQLELVADGVDAAAAGFDHVAVVQQGRLSLFGPHHRPSDAPLLLPVPLPAPVAAVAAGEHHVLILTVAGDVYALGSNIEGQLGVIDIKEHVQKPVLVMGPSAGGEAVTAVAAGARHSLAVGASGRVFAWGCSLHGQCGTGAVEPSVSSPTAVAALGPLRATAVAAGSAHSLCLTDSGDVYVWGSNQNGQIGYGNSGGAALEPVLVEALGAGDDPVTAVAAGARHCAALCRSGAAWAWGYGAFGQLGNGAVGDAAAPRRVACGGAVTALAAGWWHTLFVTGTD